MRGATIGGKGLAAILAVAFAASYLPALLYGLSVWQAARSILLIIVLWLLPGVAIMRPLLHRVWPAWAIWILGGISGVLLAGTLSYLAALIQMRWMAEALLLPLGIAGAACCIVDARAMTLRVDAGPVAVLLAVWIVIVVSVVSHSARDCRLLPDGRYHIGYIDTPWHVAIASFSQVEAPPPTPSFAALPLRYHHFSSFLVGRLATLAGIDAADAYLRIMRPLLLLGVVMSLVVFGGINLPAKPWAVPMLAAMFFFLGGPHDFLYLAHTALQMLAGNTAGVLTNPLSGNLDRVHLIAGSGGTFFLLLPGLVMALVTSVSRNRAHAPRCLAAAGILIVLSNGFSSLFAITATLAIIFWIVCMSILWRRPVLILIALTIALASLSLKLLVGQVPVPIIFSWEVSGELTRKLAILAGALGIGLGARCFWLAELPMNRATWRAQWVEKGFLLLLASGWCAGFLALSLPGFAELHFLVYFAGLASLYSVAWWTKSVPALIAGSAIPGARALLRLLLPLFIIALGLFLVKASQFASIFIILVAIIVAGLMIPRTKGIRSLALILALVLCAPSAFDLYLRMHLGRLGYTVPAGLTQCSQWIGKNTLPGERFLSAVLSLPGAERADEAFFAPQAVAQRPSIGDASKFAGVQQLTEFHTARESIDAILKGSATSEQIRDLFRIAETGKPQTTLYLLAQEEQVGSEMNYPIVTRADDYVVISIAMPE